MHIAFFASGVFPYKIGGIQKHTTNVVKYLSSQGIRVTLFYLRDRNHPPEANLASEQFSECDLVSVREVIAGPYVYFPGHYYYTCWRQAVALRDAMMASGEEYDFLFAQGYMGWASAKSRRRGKRLPPVGIHGHGLEAFQEDTGLTFRVRNCFAPYWLRQNVRLADVNLSLGGGCDALLKEQGAKSVVPAFNGIDEGWLCDPNAIGTKLGATRFLFVGRDTPRKGFSELDIVVKEICSDPRFEMHFVGDIPDHRMISAPNVFYHGVIRDENRLMEVYRASDVLLVPSHSEGMPTVILEAMASGMAVIATDVGAVALCVSEDIGRLLPPRRPDLLSAAICDAMSEDWMPKRNAARKTVERFLWPNVVKEFGASLEQYLAGAK